MLNADDLRAELYDLEDQLSYLETDPSPCDRTAEIISINWRIADIRNILGE
jgi:hypothetical protein